MKVRVIGLISFFLILFFIVSCENEGSLEFKRYYSNGAAVYQAHCQNCHGTNGEGLSALIPPLTDSVYLRKNKVSLACLIKFGLKGEITVKGKIFNETMPANDLSPMETAQVLTYISNSFGNKIGIINEQQAQADLRRCRND